jgi:hypothetical protein
VPTIDTGTASSGMIDARQVCRNRITTSTTSARIASSSVVTTAFDRLRARTASGRRRSRIPRLRASPSDMSAMVARTPSLMASALEPGAGRWDGAGRVLVVQQRAQARSRPAPSSMRAMSRKRVMAPSALVLTMMSPNSSSVFSRPWALTDSCTSTPARPGDAPTTPAATCTFCSRMAATTSAGGQAALRGLLRVQPDAHGVVARAEQLHVAHAGMRASRSFTFSTA